MLAGIEIKEVSKLYQGGQNSGISNVSFTFLKGEFIAVIGESGSGKSTLLKLIFGLLSPDTGQILFEGTPVPGPDQKLIPGHDRMKMVTQDFSLNTYAKVYDNIASMLSNDDLRFKKERTQEMMKFLRIDHLSEKRIVELSGGEQQRVAIARAIITNPDVLLLDEPFSQIDTVLKNELRKDLKRLSRDLGISIILVSHDPLDGMSLADKLIILRKGTIVQEGVPSQVAQNPDSAYVASLLGDANIISANHFSKIFSNVVVSPGSQIAVYPNHVSIINGGIPGVIKTATYKFLYYEYEICILDNLIIKAISEKTDYSIGETVGIEFKHYNIVDP